MPPPAVRRSVSVALGLSLDLALLAAGPLLLVLAGLARALGRPKPLIAVRLVLDYCAREVVVMAACAGLWVASGLGAGLGRPRQQRAHWELLRWYVHGIAAHARRRLAIDLRDESAAPAAAALHGAGPVIVLSRHAGPGDTVFLIDHLMTACGRRPSVVLLEKITFDPAIGLLVDRLPHGAIDNRKGNGDPERLIAELAAGLKQRGALLLYPEGGNFTPERRRRALTSLRRHGRHRAAALATQMANVLPPRPAGVLAALRGNPDAPVLFVAHTGLGLAAYPAEIYRELPIGRTLRVRAWLVDPADIPAADEDRVAWLNGWWQRLDDWVRRGGAEPDGRLLSDELPA
jgi:1-acyl-sn-glycerol-3-phosphate acyltransferase